MTTTQIHLSFTIDATDIDTPSLIAADLNGRCAQVIQNAGYSVENMGQSVTKQHSDGTFEYIDDEPPTQPDIDISPLGRTQPSGSNGS
ncbi:MAG: hypothetical protein AAGD25_06370 [Cyanobacteria bacterium P01_F01_bin.150]